MISLASQKRSKEEKTQGLRKEGWIPGVLYGPKTEGVLLKVAEKEFGKVYQEAGESSLIDLNVEGNPSPVLIREIQKEPLRGKTIHVDFYQPPLDRAIEVMVPLVFEGEALAVKDLGGTLSRNLQEVEVKALPQNLPHEIRVDTSSLATFVDKILVKDLTISADVEIVTDSEDTVAQVVPIEDVESELEKPVEEKVEEVEDAKQEKKDEKEEEENSEEK